MAVKIRCINKDQGDHDNPHEAISHFGWINESNGESGKSTRLQMVRFIEIDNGRAYVKDNSGNVAFCYVRTSSKGNKFIQTIADGKYSDNLLSLKECL